MIRTCLLLILSCFSFAAFSQSEKIYFDNDWKECPKSEAKFYRIVDESQRKSSGLYLVKDYYISEVLQMEGSFSDKNLEIHEGKFVFYSEEGEIEKECFYTKDLLEGDYKTYFETSKLMSSEFYVNDKRQGECSYFFNNGNKSSVEVYDNDSLISYKMFNRDGSTAPDTDDLTRAAEYPGGKAGLNSFLKENLVYPPSAIEAEIEGKCYVRFIIDSDGTISDVSIAKKVPNCPECDAEAKRVVESMPNWLPGINHHKAVKSYFNLPFTFKLTGPTPKKSRRR